MKKQTKIIILNTMILMGLIIAYSIIIEAFPSPHNVDGTIFNDGGDYALGGISVTLNVTNTSDFVRTRTNGAGPPIVDAAYTTSVNGSDGDTLIVIAWNLTHYGINTTNLSSGTTYADVILNTTRPSETNVTILVPANDSVRNTSYSFNVTVNVSIFGGKGGINCNATISFSNPTVLNVSAGENLTNQLGDITLGAHNTTIWNVSVIGEGRSNITVVAECINQTINFENVNIDYAYNITTFDTSNPVVSLISPENSSMVRRNITFSYTVSDHSIISNCSLVLNDTARANSTNVIKDITQNFKLFLDFGDYEYYINCSDNSSNSNVGSSETRFFNVSDKDITISSFNITFSNNNPIENEIIIINATIYNIGEENVSKDFTVQFFDGDPDVNGVQVGSDYTINGLNASSNISINVSWSVVSGTYNFYVLVDAPLSSNGSINEVNESNNKANNTIFTPSSNIYYGDIAVDVVLVSALNYSVIMWLNETDINGNVFFIDSDSSITWTNLTALGINSSGNNATYNDFEEIDVALNLTNHTDSINATYSYDGLARNPDSFLIYTTNITNIPIINSTNNSNFITGILWDSSDPSHGEYNGTQDLVFATKVSKNSPGRYGVYDYEIKIPANLRRYLIPDTRSSLDIYTELN
ncbi:MAG: hypothetical protein U9O94_11840 [Nanoarchaeota archaeon]|nr:hypothetical protein [Nanoarchaeota archaeon]